ncbi:MAG TPA: type II secretion system F family protein [Propionibacteriaceae bacterium]|nr:type II secretion system F family protein [Propionibacteriaceae bacterium]
MTEIVAITAGLLITGGLLGILVGLRQPTPPGARRRAKSAGELWARLTRRPPGLRGRRRDVILLLSLIIGCVIAMLTHWLIMIVVLPAAAIGLPYLLVLPKPRDVELLEALDRWVRSLAATLATGKSITDAIRISRRTAPPLIADEINLLVTRLNNRWETRDALMRFADSVDSPDADAVIAALILASSRGANGASITLDALADSIQAQLKGRRAVEVERSKPYVVVRQVTVISLSTLVLVFVLSPDFFAPYRTPLGQMLLSLLLISYIASLILMRRKAHQADRPRILLGEHR